MGSGFSRLLRGSPQTLQRFRRVSPIPVETRRNWWQGGGIWYLAGMPAPPERKRIRARVASSPMRQVLGENLVRAREAKDMSQFALARASGVTQSYISLIERGEVSAGLDIIDILARHVGLTPAELLTPPPRRKGR
jgi:DNA-binding XRE family transcriptional regulator